MNVVLDTLIFDEGTSDAATPGRHELRRLWLDNTAPGPVIPDAVIAGNEVLLQDSLIHGDFGTCVRAGGGDRNFVINVTCRLTGTPYSGFIVDEANDSYFVNLVVDLPGSSSLFSAASNPSTLTAEAITYNAFVLAQGFTVLTAAIAQQSSIMFVSPTNSRLMLAATPIDAGIDVSTLVGVSLVLGDALDGVERFQGLGVDRGAYEQ